MKRSTEIKSVNHSNTGAVPPHMPAAHKGVDLSEIAPPPPPPTPGIGLPETRGGDSEQVARRRTDADLELFARKERIGKVVLLTLAILLIGFVIGSWHWQLGVVFVGLSALVCASESRDENAS